MKKNKFHEDRKNSNKYVRPFCMDVWGWAEVIFVRFSKVLFLRIYP